MSSEDVKAEEIILELNVVSEEEKKSSGFFVLNASKSTKRLIAYFQHERGEEKNCFLNPTIEQVVVIRRLYKSRKKNLLSFSLFSVSSIIWMLQDC